MVETTRKRKIAAMVIAAKNQQSHLKEIEMQEEIKQPCQTVGKQNEQAAANGDDQNCAKHE